MGTYYWFYMMLSLFFTPLLGHVSAALDPIVIKGSKFFYPNGTQFFIKGVAYQQDPTDSTTYIDPLSNPVACARDIPKLVALGANTIRTYAIDPAANHTECMALLDAAGIYVISDLSEPRQSINRDEPSWHIALLARYKAVVDELGRYSNVIGFFAGNEVTNSPSNTDASAYVKAAVRDTKAYIKSKMAGGGRWIGVGYASNDDPGIRVPISQYLNCGNPDDAIDFWGYNIYSWCGHSSFQRSGYASQVEFFRNYSVPVFLAEYGCNTQGGAESRLWEETVALYSDDMAGVFSGGIAYMYFEEKNDYGLVDVSNGIAVPMKNYTVLQSVLAKATPSSTSMTSYTPTNTPQTCPSVNAAWDANGTHLPPTPDTKVCDCMYSLLSCVPSPSLPLDAYGPLFDSVCGSNKDGKLCGKISGNTTTATYGAFEMCDDKQKLGYVLNEYYESHGSKASACSFGGKAVITTPVSGDAATSCTAVLKEAGASAATGRYATLSMLRSVDGIRVGNYLLAIAGVFLVLI